jgi:hypothetical protein
MHQQLRSAAGTWHVMIMNHAQFTHCVVTRLLRGSICLSAVDHCPKTQTKLVRTQMLLSPLLLTTAFKPLGFPAAAEQTNEQQLATIHLQIIHHQHFKSSKHSSSNPSSTSTGGNGNSSSSNSSTKTIETSSSQLDLARLEEQHGVKVLKLLTTQGSEVPCEDDYEEAVMQLLTLQGGEHVWLIAQSTGRPRRSLSLHYC